MPIREISAQEALQRRPQQPQRRRIREISPPEVGIPTTITAGGRPRPVPTRTPREIALSALESAPAAGATLGLTLGAPTGPGALGAAALGGAAGEAFQQLGRRALGAPTPTTPLGAAKQIGIEGAISGAAEAAFRGAGRVVRPIAKVGGKFLRKFLGGALDILSGSPAGAGEVLIKARGRIGEVSAQQVDEVIEKVIKGSDAIRKSAQEKFEAAVQTELRKTGRAGIVPKEAITGILNQMQAKLKIGIPGEIVKASPKAIRQAKSLTTEIEKTLQNRGTIDVDNLLTLRRRFDKLIEQAAGERLETSAFASARGQVDDLIRINHSTIKIADNAFAESKRLANQIKGTLGIPENLKPDQALPQGVRQSVESKLEGVFKGRATFRDALKTIDDKLSTIDNFLGDAEKLGVAQAFSKNTSGLGRIGLLGTLIGGTGELLQGEISPTATRAGGVLAATSPRFLAGVTRGAFGLGRGVSGPIRAGTRFAAQVGARALRPSLEERLR